MRRGSWLAAIALLAIGAEQAMVAAHAFAHAGAPGAERGRHDASRSEPSDEASLADECLLCQLAPPAALPAVAVDPLLPAGAAVETTVSEPDAPALHLEALLPPPRGPPSLPASS